MARYKVTFYSKRLEKEVTKIMDANSVEDIEYGVKYYGASKEDIIRYDMIDGEKYY